MKQYKILITNQAKNDLSAIFDYISNELKEPNIAVKLIRKIKEEVMLLSKMPSRFTLITDERLANLGIRKALVENYIIFYSISNKANSVYIIRILYGKRDWASLL